MCALEGAEAARGTASGMAAVNGRRCSAISRPATTWSRRRALFGCCRYIVEDLLPRYGITDAGRRPRSRRLGGGGTAQHARSSSRRRPTRCWSSSTSQASAKIAKKAGALVVVDNVFATPMLQRPMELGADIVVYSATKHIDGQGRCLGGVVLARKSSSRRSCTLSCKQPARRSARSTPGCCSRASRRCPCASSAHGESAARIADFLANSPKSRRVLYPGRADHPQHALATRQMTAAGRWWRSRSRATRRRVPLLERARDLQDHEQSRRRQEPRHASRDDDASAAHAERAPSSASSTSVRLSVGLEDVEDLKADLDQALRAQRRRTCSLERYATFWTRRLREDDHVSKHQDAVQF